MDKVLNFLKGVFASFLDLLLHPVAKVTEIVQKEDMKKGAIKAAIFAFSLSIIKVLATVRAAHLAYTTSSVRDRILEDFNPILAILKYFGLYLLAIAAIALILFAIAKLVKDSKPLPYTLSMTVNAGVVFVVGSLLGLIFSFWTPLAMLIIDIAVLHSGLTLIVTFISSLSNINTDKLVLVTTAILLVATIVLAIFKLITTDVDLNKYEDNNYINTTKLEDVVIDYYNNNK